MKAMARWIRVEVRMMEGGMAGRSLSRISHSSSSTITVSHIRLSSSKSEAFHSHSVLHIPNEHYVQPGIYLATALLFITKLFDLYRLNWWPRSLGGLKSYTFFWATSLAVGFGCHWGDVFGIGRRRSMGGGQDGQGDEVDWERKSRSIFRIKSALVPHTQFPWLTSLEFPLFLIWGLISLLDCSGVLDNAHASVRLLFQAQTGSTAYVPAQLDRVAESVSSRPDSLSYSLVWAKSNLGRI
jgi:hypothetical protein